MTRAWVVLVVMAAIGCGDDVRPGGGPGDGGRPSDSGGGMDSGAADASPPDVGPNLDAFFAMDPPPAYCGPDGGMGAPPTSPGGTPECPDDKNREGCRCDGIGETQACWTGLRANRNRGMCMDGMATCEPFDEFTGRWGPCMGAILPTPGVRLGPASCRCFSAGRWNLANLSPCFYQLNGGAERLAVSTVMRRLCPNGTPCTTNADCGGAACELRADCPTEVEVGLNVTGGTPHAPAAPWTTDQLSVDCEGEFDLCFTLKAGNAAMPAAGDCVVARVCTSGWYQTKNMLQDFPPLPGWIGNAPSERECAQRFDSTGGYGEMSVIGRSVECDAIDDGSGGEYVFNRVNYCPSSCNTMPEAPECQNCGMGGSGDF